MSILTILVVVALIFTILSAIKPFPLWAAVLVLVLIELIQIAPRL